MVIAVFADIHGNLEAFSSVIAQIREDGVDRIISLGDTIGYGADSEKIIGLLHKHGVESVIGNHELAVIHKPFIKWFNPTAQKAVRHAIDSLSEKSRQTISRFKKSLVIEKMRFVHGAPPSSVALYLFQISDKNLSKKMDAIDETLCFTGHTHDIGLIEYDGATLVRNPLEKGVTHLNPGKKYIVNAGSVGQPRDGDNRAKYIVCDTKKMTIDLRYVSYDYKAAAEKIRLAGIPEEYARKLYPAEK